MLFQTRTSEKQYSSNSRNAAILAAVVAASRRHQYRSAADPAAVWGATRSPLSAKREKLQPYLPFFLAPKLISHFSWFFV
jgi:hypothetical protein